MKPSSLCTIYLITHTTQIHKQSNFLFHVPPLSRFLMLARCVSIVLGYAHKILTNRLSYAKALPPSRKQEINYSTYIVFNVDSNVVLQQDQPISPKTILILLLTLSLIGDSPMLLSQSTIPSSLDVGLVEPSALIPFVSDRQTNH